MIPPEIHNEIERISRLRTKLEIFDDLVLIGTSDEINENEHRLKHFQVKLSELFKERIITFNVSIVDNTFFCCVITRYIKNTFITDKAFVDKLLSGEEPMTDKLIQLIKGGNSDERNYNFSQ